MVFFINGTFHIQQHPPTANEYILSFIHISICFIQSNPLHHVCVRVAFILLALKKYFFRPLSSTCRRHHHLLLRYARHMLFLSENVSSCFFNLYLFFSLFLSFNSLSVSCIDSHYSIAAATSVYDSIKYLGAACLLL